MELLSAGAALFAALMLLFGTLAIIGFVADIIQKLHNKRHPQQKRKPLSISDFPINDYRGPGNQKVE